MRNEPRMSGIGSGKSATVHVRRKQGVSGDLLNCSVNPKLTEKSVNRRHTMSTKTKTKVAPLSNSLSIPGVNGAPAINDVAAALEDTQAARLAAWSNIPTAYEALNGLEKSMIEQGKPHFLAYYNAFDRRSPGAPVAYKVAGFKTIESAIVAMSGITDQKSPEFKAVRFQTWYRRSVGARLANGEMQGANAGGGSTETKAVFTLVTDYLNKSMGKLSDKELSDVAEQVNGAIRTREAAKAAEASKAPAPAPAPAKSRSKSRSKSNATLRKAA